MELWRGGRRDLSHSQLSLREGEEARQPLCASLSAPLPTFIHGEGGGGGRRLSAPGRRGGLQWEPGWRREAGSRGKGNGEGAGQGRGESGAVREARGRVEGEGA